MATWSITVSDRVASDLRAAIKLAHSDETEGMTNTQVQKFGLTQGLRSVMSSYQVSLVDKTAQDTAIRDAADAQATALTEGATVKTAQDAARVTAEADMDSIT